MSDALPILLSDLIEQRPDALPDGAVHHRAAHTSRRDFLVRASALAVAIPSAGAALAACSTPSERSPKDSARATAASGSQAPAIPQNADSRLDTAHGTAGHTGSSATASTASGSAAAPYRRFDPALPPLSRERTLKLQWTARELPVRISPTAIVAAWTFEGDIPGPIVHCRLGDTIEFTLTNRGVIPHSMDFHAAQIDPKVAFRSVVPGESITYTFKPKYAGAFMYHCGTGPVLMHIGSGMYGALIVDPAAPLPPAKEFVLVESEYYLGAQGPGGVQAFDFNKMLATLPDLVAFNGRPSQYQTDPIHVKVGDRVRFYVVSAGPSHPCNFHIVGEQFDTVYLGAPPTTAIRGVQTFTVAPGGGMVFEFLADVPGEFPFVNHGFGHGQKGAIGILVVDA
ncbi:MAG: multicopper oxidase domain-containing protein [Gemmatimonadaceae bacterium]